MQQKSVLLLGSYGQTNLGDDLLMWNYLTFLRDRGFTRIVVNASAAQNIPTIIKQEFPDLDVHLTYQTSLLDWIKILANVSCVAYGGGTIFKELYSSTGRGKYSVIGRILLFNMLARCMGKKIYNLHIGLGVLKTTLGRFITRWALKTATYTLLRDEQSYSFARDTLKLRPSSLCLATDGLFINDRWQKAWHSAPSLPKGNYRNVVGINFLSDIPDWIDRDSYLQTARQFVNTLLQDNNLVVLIPFQHDFNPNNDYRFMQEEIVPYVTASPNLVQLPKIEIDQVVDLFTSLDVFVGMRFHSLLLAASTATPFVGIAYDTKCWRFITESNYPYGIQLEDITQQRLQTTYQQLLAKRTSTKAALQAITKAQQKEGATCISNLHF